MTQKIYIKSLFRILLIDEAAFTRNGITNFHNDHA